MPQTAVVYDNIFRKHATPAGHPERSERYDAVISALERTGFAQESRRVKPRAATEDELALCHTRPYIELAKREIAAGAEQLSTGDTDVMSESWDVAVQAVGSTLACVDAVFAEGPTKRAFCAVRPPGHHATANRGMGFCLFNNVAIAARYAQAKYGIQRVMILDFDVHHGNGTQDIFYNDGSVLFCSTHQHPWYPGTGLHNEHGEGKGEGCIVNYPFPAGAGRKEILGTLMESFRPKALSFQPELVLVSAGFDSRDGDPLGRFRLTDDDFQDLTHMLRDIAETTAGGRLVSVLEGGYSLAGLAASLSAHLTGLA